jgi:hypothetical protein
VNHFEIIGTDEHFIKHLCFLEERCQPLKVRFGSYLKKFEIIF